MASPRAVHVRSTVPDVPDVPQIHPMRRLPVAALRVDYDYQHRPYASAVDELRKHFQIEWCGPILVNRRESGDQFVIDGSTRLQVHIDLHYSHIVAEVVEGLTQQQEAQVYSLKAINRQRVPIDLFRGRCVAGEPKAVLLKSIVESFDLEIYHFAQQPAPHVKGTVSAVATLERLMKKEPSGECLRATFDLILATWGYSRAALTKAFLPAVFELVVRYDTQMSRNRFLEKLSAYDIGQLSDLARNRREGSTERNMTTTRAMQLVLIEIYNKGLREGKLGGDNN
jgi:hypothetical protein